MSRFKSFSSIRGANWIVGQKLLPLLEEIGRAERGDILDLGCGESPFRGYFDCARSYRRVDRVAEDPDVVPGDLKDIPFPGNAFDLVLLFQALTDVPCTDSVLCEIRRVLRPGGRLLVFESMCYPEHDAPHDYYRLMPQGLTWIAAKTGFRVDEVVPLGGLFARFASLWNTFVMGRLTSWQVTWPLGALGIIAANVVCFSLDRLLPHPRLAPDYLAVLSRGDPPGEAVQSTLVGIEAAGPF